MRNPTGLLVGGCQAQLEKDRRGYVEEKGWAHCVAHTADALDACARHPAATASERVQIMGQIARLATLVQPLCHLEGDRLSYPAYRIIGRRQVDDDYLESWLNSFLMDLDFSPEAAIRRTNAEHFLQNLYFLLHWQQPGNPFLEKISTVLMKLNIFYQCGMLAPE